MNEKHQQVSFWADAQTLEAIKIVSLYLGRGNQSEGIRRAVIDAATRITDGRNKQKGKATK